MYLLNKNLITIANKNHFDYHKCYSIYIFTSCATFKCKTRGHLLVACSIRLCVRIVLWICRCRRPSIDIMFSVIYFVLQTRFYCKFPQQSFAENEVWQWFGGESRSISTSKQEAQMCEEGFFGEQLLCMFLMI